MGRPKLPCRLTARQSALLGLLSRGYPIGQAAATLGVSERRAADDPSWACRG